MVNIGNQKYLQNWNKLSKIVGHKVIAKKKNFYPMTMNNPKYETSKAIIYKSIKYNKTL